MIIDMHAHLEPRTLGLGSLISKMDQVGIDKVVMIPVLNDPFPETPDFLLSAMRKVMASKKSRSLAEIAHRAHWTPEGNLKFKDKIYQIYHRPDNQTVADAIQQYPNRILGWIFLNPRNNPNVLDELEYWRDKPGMIGVKLHPHWHDYRTEILNPLLKRTEELNLPVLIHLGFRKRGDYRTIAENFPDLNLICAHAGFPFFKDLWNFGRSHRNLYVDLSSPYLNESLAHTTVEALGAHKCLFGTDSPYGFHESDGSYNYQHIYNWITRLPVSSNAKEQIFGGNFCSILEKSGSTF